MPQSLASRSHSPEMAAAMSRHPASGGRGPVTALFGADVPGEGAPAAAPGPASFATVAALLTGPWRVDDPVGFAAAMRAAPLVAGYPVVPFTACASGPAAGLDPLSAAVAGHLESAVAEAGRRPGLTIRWVAARGGGDLFVEAAAQAAAGAEGPELLVLAHLVEPLEGGYAVDDDSWMLAVVGDGRGGVSAIGRVALSTGDRSRPATAVGFGRRLPLRLNLEALRARLAGPARAAEGLGPHPSQSAAEGVVLPFRR